MVLRRLYTILPLGQRTVGVKNMRVCVCAHVCSRCSQLIFLRLALGKRSLGKGNGSSVIKAISKCVLKCFAAIDLQ